MKHFIGDTHPVGLIGAVLVAVAITVILYWVAARQDVKPECVPGQDVPRGGCIVKIH